MARRQQRRALHQAALNLRKALGQDGSTRQESCEDHTTQKKQQGNCNEQVWEHQNKQQTEAGAEEEARQFAAAAEEAAAAAEAALAADSEMRMPSSGGPRKPGAVVSSAEMPSLS